MNEQQRGRSPSVGQQNHIRHSPSPSPHGGFRTNGSGLGLDQSLVNTSNGGYDGFNGQLPTSGQTSYDLSSQYLTPSQPQQFTQQNLSDHSFLEAQNLPPNTTASPQFGDQQLFSDNNLGLTPPVTSSEFDAQFFTDESLNNNFLDPQLLGNNQQQGDSGINPANLMNQMGSQANSPTPPNLLAPGMQQSASGSPSASPSMNQGAFSSPGHSRHTSLDPSSAQYPQQGQSWENMNMGSYRNHRRAPSDTYSDVSSNHPSPFLPTQESFDTSDNPSPLLGAQTNDPALFDNMNFNQFSISEAQPQHISPGQSPHISPRLMPQQALPSFTAANNYGMPPSLSTMNEQMNANNTGIGIYSSAPPAQEPFPTLNQGNGSGEFSQANQMSPPEINIDFAPPSRQPSFEPARSPDHMEGALSPPDRSRSRNRMRAKSDPFSGASSRASTPASGHSEPSASLSPNAAKLSSRSPSPSTKSNRRSSTSSIPHRDYILDLADPTRPGSSSSAGGASGETGPKRTQKHPATFQCSLCPKRFTRAYNLRSHLRTHTDERPFVCSVCGKAFARQHDRKRHEGLHSGEKKFVCRGTLKEGGSWGCGRRFARADALGRHFRSEAGRVCIRPLLEEEAMEKGWELNQQQDQQNQSMMPSGAAASTYGAQQQMVQQQMQMQGGYEPFPSALPQPQSYGLPQALLQQYPALAGIQWDTLPPGPPEEMEGEISGRSSFDASSGGEEMFAEEEDYRQQQGIPVQQQQNTGYWS